MKIFVKIEFFVQIRLKFEAPKRPMTSFARFQKTLDRGKMGIIDFVKHAATKWKALAPAEKQVKLIDEFRLVIN